ncbi:hypothetical protein [Pyrococcus sp. NA2]|nr:hypothetical protein [Pyrococcus sp. NA2]
MLRNILILVLGIVIRSGIVGAANGTINPEYFDPGTGGGDVVYL